MDGLFTNFHPLTVLISGSGTRFDMQRILECNLGIDLCTIILRHSILHRLEVEEIKRISKLFEELTDACRIDKLLTSEGCLNLHILNGADIRRAQILKLNLSLMIALQLLLETETNTIKVEY